MMGLPGRRTLFAGLAFAALAGVTGCVEDESLFLLNPEGPPEVVAAFVTVETAPDYEVRAVYEEFFVGVALTFGAHPDINEGAPVTTAATTTILRSQVRVMMDELLDGRSVEQFKCACWHPFVSATGAITLAGTDGCPLGMPKFNDSPNPDSCGGCPDDEDTPEIETDRCEDANLDGVGDDSVLKPGVATVSCDNASFTTYALTEFDGDYQPTGSLILPASLSLVGVPPIDGMGPAFRFRPRNGFFFPSSSNCNLNVNANNTIVDKDGNALAPTAIPFQTTATRLTAVTVPHNPVRCTSTGVPTGCSVGVSGAAVAGGRNYDLTFNGQMPNNPTNLGRVTLTCTGGTGGAQPLPAVIVPVSALTGHSPPGPIAGVGNVIRLATPPMTGYGTNQTCTLTIAAGFVDNWGNPVTFDLQSRPTDPPGPQNTLTFLTGSM